MLGQELGFPSQTAWIQICALPLPRCMTLGKLPNVSLPNFSSVKWSNDSHRTVVRIN